MAIEILKESDLTGNNGGRKLLGSNLQIVVIIDDQLLTTVNNEDGGFNTAGRVYSQDEGGLNAPMTSANRQKEGGLNTVNYP